MKAFTVWASISEAFGIIQLAEMLRLAQANTDVGIPVMTSSKGYMMLWDNPAVTTISTSSADDTNSNQKTLRWSSEAGKALDYYFCYGDGTIATAMKGLPPSDRRGSDDA